MHVLDSLIHSPWLAEMVWVSALIAALAYAVRSARRDGLDPRVAYWGGVFALGLGAWGSSLLGLYYYGTGGLSWAWLRLWSGGRAEYGGLLAGLLAIAVYLRIRRQPFLRYVDSITPAVALGIAIGRIGCFINGDDFGTRTQLPWGVSFPLGTEAYADHFARGWLLAGTAHSLPVHPVQLYSSLLAGLLFAGLVYLRTSAPGTRFAVFACVHGASRFFLQYWRGDFERVAGPFSLTQLISAGLVLLGGGVLLRQWMSKPVAISAAMLQLHSEGS